MKRYFFVYLIGTISVVGLFTTLFSKLDKNVIQANDPQSALYDIYPSGDQSGQTDTTAFNQLVEQNGGNARISVAPGKYYFTKQGTNNGLIDLRSQKGEFVHGVTIDGQDMNHTTFYMVGTETNQGADWYLFSLNETKKFTLKNITIDGSQLQTVAEQTHGINAIHADDLTVENVRGQYIHGDTAKLIYTCQNCKFYNTEHIENGRSGISMRGSDQDPNSLTYGGVTIDGFYSKDVSDQAIDMEPGFEPGELILTNGRIYGENNNGLCLSIVGNGGENNRMNINNWQVYCKTYLFNAGQVLITNSIFDASKNSGPALLLQKASHEVAISNSIITSDGQGGALKLTVHNSGRPDRVLLSNLIINVKNTTDNSGAAINIYDSQNVSLSNIDIRNEKRLGNGIVYRDVANDIDRGHLSITDVKINNAENGIRISSTSNSPSMIDTAVITDNHLRNVTTGIRVENPSAHTTKYIRDLVIADNAFGENVTNEIILGSLFQ